jgi:FMN phosphatase YigB (HAD superfamily)
LASAIIIDVPDVLTDESKNESDAVALIRQIVATAGQRVSEQALAEAEKFAVESFAPNPFEAMIFKLVNRDTTLALRCVSGFKKNFKPATVIRREAVEILQLCRSRGWKVATAQRLDEEQVAAFQKAGLAQFINVNGPPAGVKLALPDPRVFEFLVGRLGVSTGDCIVLGTRIDNVIRPANTLRMTSIHLHEGRHGRTQLPRDLKDVADYEAPDVQGLLNVLPTVV